MFELLSDGTVESLCLKFKSKGVPYGFGGVARVGTGILPAECVLGEHYRLGSDRVILSRAFCDVAKETDFEVVKEKTGLSQIDSIPFFDGVHLRHGESERIFSPARMSKGTLLILSV